MTNPIGTNTSAIRFPKREALGATSSPQPTAKVQKADSLELGSKPDTSGIEADLSLSVVGSSVAPNGTVQVNHAVLERFLQQSLQGNPQISEPQIAFDSQSGVYQIAAKVKVMGANLPLSAKVRLVSDQNSLGFALEDARIPLGSEKTKSLGLNWLTKMLSEQISKSVSEGGIPAQADSKNGIIRLDTNALLKKSGVMPRFLSIDPAQTRLSLKTSTSGDVTLTLQSDRQGPPITATKDSDLALSLDESAVTLLLRQALLQDADIDKVTFNDGGLKIEGKAEVKEASALLSGAKVLLALMALSSNSSAVTNVDPVHAKVPVSLDLAIQGNELAITPSYPQLLDLLEKSAKNAGADPIRDQDSIRVDLNSFLAKQQGSLESVEATPEGLKMNLHVNAKGLL